MPVSGLTARPPIPRSKTKGFLPGMWRGWAGKPTLVALSTFIQKHPVIGCTYLVLLVSAGDRGYGGGGYGGGRDGGRDNYGGGGGYGGACPLTGSNTGMLGRRMGI